MFMTLSYSAYELPFVCQVYMNQGLCFVQVWIEYMIVPGMGDYVVALNFTMGHKQDQQPSLGWEG